MTDSWQAVAEALPAYEVGSELGRGGWGVVLEGRHRQLGREVAIKQLPPGLAADSSVLGRFIAEARVLAALDHPHIVPIYDYVEKDGLCLLVMEKLPGGTVWARFTSQGFVPATACAMVLAVCAGLQAAHDRGILHRDVKPENLMYSASGAIKVTDFGIAKMVGGESTMATRTGDVLGTPAYIAPEQARGLEVSPATDVYAVATMLYELLSGRLPFDDDGDAMALLFKHAFEQPTPLLEKAPDVPAPIADVVMQGLLTDPAERPATAEAFGVALAEACTATWGPGWLSAEGTPVMGAGPILAATERVTGGRLAQPGPSAPGPTRGTVVPNSGASSAPATFIPGPSGSAPPTVVPDSAASAAPATFIPGPSGSAPPTVIPGSGTPAPATVVPGSGTPAPGAVVPPAALATSDVQPAGNATAPPTVRPSGTTVRPSTIAHRRGADLAGVGAEELIPVQQIVAPPGGMRGGLVAAGLLLLLVLLAIVGLGGPSYSGHLPRGSTRVAGADPAAGQVVTVDLAKPVPVLVNSAPAGGSPLTGADHVRLSLSVLGATLLSVSAPLTSGPFGTGAVIEPGSNRYLVAGQVTGQLQILRAGSVVGTQSFPVQLSQQPIETAPGGLAVVLFLAVVAYAESYLRSLRRGRKQLTAQIGLVIFGALLGLDAVAGAWLALDRQPTAPVLVVCVVLGAGAGLAAGRTALQIGRRRRFVRRQARTTAR